MRDLEKTKKKVNQLLLLLLFKRQMNRRLADVVSFVFFIETSESFN